MSTSGENPEPTKRSLRDLAEDAESRMTPENLALHREIEEICENFGEPVDVVALIREIRDNA